jgi:peptidoglycan/xylan/chitin deacetylase (PgdA/CDA1 family)
MLHGQAAPPRWSQALARKGDRVRSGIPILMYHLVSPDVPAPFRSYTVTPARFRQQLQALRRLRFTSIGADDLVAAWDGSAPLPARPVLITFDDGFRDCLTHAAPVLQEHGFTATMYVVGGLLGGRSRWMTDVPDLPLVDAGELRELEAAGVRCESHAWSHPRLATLGSADIRRELRDSRAALEDVLGHEVRHLAYPHGSHDARVLDEARAAGYRSGCTTLPAKAVATDDVMALPRVKVDGRDGLPDFVSRLLVGKDAGFLLRRVAGRRRG